MNRDDPERHRHVLPAFEAGGGRQCWDGPRRGKALVVATQAVGGKRQNHVMPVKVSHPDYGRPS